MIPDSDNPYVTGRPTAGGPDSGGGGGGGGGGGDRPDIVGGFAYRPPTPTMGYSYGYIPPTPFDPYRTNDLNHILQMAVNRGTILDMQEALMAAGLLSGDVMFGVVDSDTEDAMETLLTIANQNGMTWQDVLSQASASGGIGGGGEGGGGYGGGSAAPLSPTMIALPNREDLDAALEQTGMTLTGERLDDDLRGTAVDSVLDALRTQQERQVQREMGLAGTGSGVAFVESAPDVNRLLEEQIRERAPQQVMDKQTRDAMDTWMALIGEQA